MNRKKDTNKEALLIARLDRDIQDIEACASQMRFDQIWEYMTLLSLYKHLHWHLKYEYSFAADEIDTLLRCERPLITLAEYYTDFVDDMEIDCEVLVGYACFNLDPDYGDD